MHFKTNKQLIVDLDSHLYKWHHGFGRLQQNFFLEPVEFRREKQIIDFIKLNEFRRVQLIKDNGALEQLVSVTTDPDLVVIIDQNFSRYPCPVIIEKIRQQLNTCSSLYLCLNRHYINIDNSYHDASLSDNFCLAITQWLKRGLPEYKILDLSLDYIDVGQSFTWVIPDRHYYITL